MTKEEIIKEWKEEVIKKIQDHIQHHDYGDFGLGATMGLMDAIQIIKETS